MISRNAVRVAATLIFLGGWSQASPAAPMGGVGASCAVQDNSALYCRAYMVEASIDVARGSGLCGGQAIRRAPDATFRTAIMELKLAHWNLCLKSNAFVPASYF